MAKLIEDGKWLSAHTGEQFDDWQRAQTVDIKELAGFIESAIEQGESAVGLCRELVIAAERYIALYDKFEREKHCSKELVCIGELSEGDELFLPEGIVINGRRQVGKQKISIIDMRDSYVYLATGVRLSFTTGVYKVV